LLVLIVGCSPPATLAETQLDGDHGELSLLAGSPTRPKLVLDVRARAEGSRNKFIADLQRSELRVTVVEGAAPRTLTCAAGNGFSQSTRDDGMKKRAFLREAANDCDLGSVSGSVRIKIVVVWRGEGGAPDITARLH